MFRWDSIIFRFVSSCVYFTRIRGDRWENGTGRIGLVTFWNAETVEFRDDGTVIIIEDGVERIETWEVNRGEEDIIVVDSIRFSFEIDGDLLMLVDDWRDERFWQRAGSDQDDLTFGDDRLEDDANESIAFDGDEEVQALIDDILETLLPFILQVADYDITFDEAIQMLESVRVLYSESDQFEDEEYDEFLSHVIAGLEVLVELFEADGEELLIRNLRFSNLLQEGIGVIRRSQAYDIEEEMFKRLIVALLSCH